MRLISIISFVTSIFMSFRVYANLTESINFTHIGLNEGLSQSTVFDITQDKSGNLWFATYNGLNKYDGYSFTVYQHNEKDSYSIGSDIIRTLFTDSDGNIWIGTYEGLSLYEEDRDRFMNFIYRKNGKTTIINRIIEFDKRTLLLYTEHEIVAFDKHTFSFSNQFFIPQMNNIVPTTISRQGDNIYIGSRSGLFTYSLANKTFIEIAPHSMRDKNILRILQQSPTHLWVGTEGNGLFLINPKTGETENYTNTPGNTNSISSNLIRALALDSQNRLWVGTINALNIYDQHNNKFTIYENNPLNPQSLSQTSIRSIFMDSQGGMWIGTFFGGLNYYHPLKNRFRNIQFTPGENSLNNNIIGCIVEDENHELWIGTNSGGINRYDLKTHTFRYYTKNDGLESNDIKEIYVDEDQDKVYIGTHAGGMSIINRKTGYIETIKNDYDTNVGTKSIYAILPVGNGELWIGTLNGIFRFNTLNKTFTKITKEKNGNPIRSIRITTIFRDSRGRLWFGCEDGLTIYQQEGNELQSVVVLPKNYHLEERFINSIYESREGVFWIGTRSGMFCFDEKQNICKQYTIKDGLPNNVVFGIMEDHSENLWISTDKGLSYFQLKTETFRNFTSNDGLQSNQFSANGYCRTHDGRMFFGGINGITTFMPERLTDNPYTPPVTIKQLRLFNKEVRPGDETGILEKSINETKSITLKSWQSMFSIEFVVSNYISGKHNTFAYMLEGYDKEWYYTNDIRLVSYSNLPHGTYRFLVKAANNDGKWNDIPTKLIITVLPVWYKTWWAILLFAVTIISLTTLIIRFLWIRKSMETQLEMERMEKERQKEVNEMKLRFFINISHELRTPLTLILAPLQDLMEKVVDRWVYKQLELIQRNTNRLLHLVNQLMDYRRAELGVFHLKVRPTLLHPIIKNDFMFYEQVSVQKNIQYDFYSEVDGKTILCDPNYLELIVNNLLSNAFKYCSSGKSICLCLKEEQDTLILEVKDTGTGIPVEKQGKIFERFYQADSEHIGSGIGLSLVQRLVELHHGRIELKSSEGMGSTFTVLLPTNISAYLPEEKAESQLEDTENKNYTTNSLDMYLLNAEITEEGQSQTGDISEMSSQKEIILIVEDNVEIRKYLADGLMKNYKVLTANNGEEAMAIVQEETDINLIITDVMMPVMDGVQLCKLLKQNLRTCHIPVFILSAKADLKEQLEGMKVGADDYIPKPFSMTLVAAKIKNQFRTRRRTIECYSQSLEMDPEKVAFNKLDEEFLKKAIEIVENHLNDIEFSTDKFAYEMCMSRSSLHNKMKAVTGEPTNEFIRKIRFNHAIKLLKSGKYNVTEVSTMVGFNSPSYFATSFKKFFGYMPSEVNEKDKRSL